MLNFHTYRCPLCSQIGFTNETLQEHVHRVHTDSKIIHLVCPLIRRAANAEDGPQLLQTNNLAGNSNLRRRSASARLQQDLTNSSASASATRHRQIARGGSHSVQSRNRRRRGSISPTNMRNACLALMSSGPTEASSPLNANLESASSVLEENLPVLLRPRSLSVPINNRRPQIARRISRSRRLRTSPTLTDNQPNNDDQSQSSSSSLSSNLRGNRSQTARRPVWRRRTATDQREFVAAATNEADESGTSTDNQSNNNDQSPSSSSSSSSLSLRKNNRPSHHQTAIRRAIWRRRVATDQRVVEFADDVEAECDDYGKVRSSSSSTLQMHDESSLSINIFGKSTRMGHHQFVAQGGSNSVRSRIMVANTPACTHHTSFSSCSHISLDSSVVTPHQELDVDGNRNLSSIIVEAAAAVSTSEHHHQHQPSANNDDNNNQQLIL